MFERPSENLLFKAEKKNFFISSLILALYGITQIILMLFFLENLQFLSIFTFITGGLYFTAGVFGITSTKNNSLKLLNSSLSLTILLMIISFLIAIGSIILILLKRHVLKTPQKTGHRKLHDDKLESGPKLRE